MKRIVFTIIAVLIPLGILLLIETSLRIAGFGKPYPLFIENPTHPDYLLPRPDILARYFTTSQQPRVTMEANFFLKQKPANGYRVFVQGGSTAAGFPYGLGASLAGMLDQRLKQSMPNKQVEVINTAMSAVNSYLLLDIADDIIAQSPDLVVIYAGHNEFLGIFGVGSSFGVGGPLLTSAYLSLHDYATVDAIRHLLPSPTPENPTSATMRRTFMSQVAKKTAITIDSPTYQAGLIQFERNLTRLVEKYHQAGVPVVISTIASNLKDQPPFMSQPNKSKGAVDIDSLSASAIAQLADESVNHTDAELHFAIAKRLLVERDNVRALRHFRLAKDHDLLRFRAPSDINKIIRTLALRDGVYLNDADYALSSRSPDGIIGNNFMLEHLHPNVAGYFVIADSVYTSISKHQLAPISDPVSTDLAWRHRPITQSEEYYGFAQVQALKADYPFVDSPIPLRLPTPKDWQQQLGRAYFEKKINWSTMMRKIRQRHLAKENHQMVLKTTLLLADALPHDALVNSQAASELEKAGRNKEASFYHKRAKRAGLVSQSID